MYKVLLFDLDDTILSFKKAEEYAIKKVFDFYGLKGNDDEINEYVKIYSDINIEYWKKLERKEIDRDSLLIKRFIDFFNAINLEVEESKLMQANDVYFKYLCSVVYTIDGALEHLKKYKDKYTLAIISNGIFNVQEKRLALIPELTELVEYYYISEHVGHVKPEKEFMDYVINDFKKHGLEFKKEEMLIIGDSLTSDMLLGFNSRIDTCWFNPDGRKAIGMNPIYNIKSYDELDEILEKEAKLK